MLEVGRRRDVTINLLERKLRFQVHRVTRDLVSSHKTPGPSFTTSSPPLPPFAFSSGDHQNQTRPTGWLCPDRNLRTRNTRCPRKIITSDNLSQLPIIAQHTIFPVPDFPVQLKTLRHFLLSAVLHQLRS